jgi:hypothetical protein
MQLSRALRSYRARDLSSTQPSPSRTELSACQGDCDMHRHSLRSVFSPSAHDSGCRFPRIDALARRVCINGRHRVRTTAPRLWLCTSLQRWLYFKSAVRGLSYPEPPDFSRWRTVQASPRVPAALLRPHQPTSAEPVLLLPYSPGASPSRFASGRRFRFMTGRHAITCVSPFPRRPAPPGRTGSV